MSTTPPAGTVPSRRVILEALRRRVSPPKVSLSYRLGLLIAGWTMVLLPLLYFGLVALPVIGVGWHVVANRAHFGEDLIPSILYLSVIPVGGIVAFFLVKPIFAEAAKRQHAHRLDRDEQRFLFTYMETLCRTIGAPPPAQIEVDVLINASAGLHLDMVTRTRKGAVLRIGLPLVAGMSLRELTGVLAHEFGIFGRGPGCGCTKRSIRSRPGLRAPSTSASQMEHDADRLPDLSDAGRSKQSLMELVTARMQFEEKLPEARTAFAQLARAVEMEENACLARCLLDAGIVPDARSFRLPSGDSRGVERLEERAASIRLSHALFIEAWEENLQRRVAAALKCLHYPELFVESEEHDAMVARARELMAAQRELQKNLDDVLALRRHLSVLELLTAQLSDEDPQTLVDQLGLLQNQAHEHLVASRDGLIYASHPFAQGDDEITIGAYLIERLPEQRLAQGAALFRVDAQLMTEVYEAGQIVGERYYYLHLRVLGALTAIAEKVESASGLALLPAPAEEDDVG